MAEGKVIGKLTNIVNFSTDKASLNKVLADIKKVKDAMKGVTQPFAKVQQQMTRANKQQARMRSDYLVVQKQLDKTEKSQLKTAEAIYKAKNKQALAEQKIANQRRAQSVRGLTSKSGAGRASQTAFADMLRQEERASKLATRTTATANNRNMRVDRRAQATQEWFGDTFGRGGSKKAAGLYNDMRAGKISAEQYSSRLRTLRAELYRNQRAQRGFNQSIHDMRGAFVQATASYTAFAGVMAAADIGKRYESRYAGMLVGTGSAEEAKNQISYLDKEVYRLGLDMNVASQGLVQMSVAANGVMQGGQLQDLFTGLSELSTAVKLDPFRYEKAIMAISQMLNKGQLMAEEVKNQLGEQLPGSLEAIRKAVSKFYKKDVSISEMFQLMKDGKLLAKDILPLLGEEFSRIARTGDALKVSLSSLNTVQQRMNTSFREWINNIYKGGLAEGLSEIYQLLDNIFWAMSQGDSASGGFLKGFLGAARDSIAAINDALNDLVLFIRYKLGIEGADAEFLGKVTYWIAIAGAMNTVAGLMKIIFGGSMLSMIVKVSTAMGGLVALPFAIVAGLQELYDKLGWIQDPKAMAQQSGAIKQMTNQALVSGMPMFAQPYFQQQLSQAQNQVQTGQITLKLETTSDVDKLIQGHIENNNQRMIQSVVPMGWTSTSN